MQDLTGSVAASSGRRRLFFLRCRTGLDEVGLFAIIPASPATVQEGHGRSSRWPKSPDFGMPTENAPNSGPSASSEQAATNSIVMYHLLQVERNPADAVLV